MEVLPGYNEMGNHLAAATGWQFDYHLKRTKSRPPPPLKMVANFTNKPKEDSNYPLGDDAHFISADNQSIGVADGVGGWRLCGIDSGEYARQLMSLAKQNIDYFKTSPKRALAEAYGRTTAEGSSTACVVSFSGEDRVLRAANVGDSGFVVVRKGAVVFRSPRQQRSFNCPYQLGPTKDDPSVAEEIEFRWVEKGDLVLLGTDGVWDNVHERELLEIVRDLSRNELKDVGWCIVETAFFNSLARFADTPYSVAARRAGKHHKGGKLDDITLVIARIE